jgi:hypothetical protein
LFYEATVLFRVPQETIDESRERIANVQSLTEYLESFEQKKISNFRDLKNKYIRLYERILLGLRGFKIERKMIFFNGCDERRGHNQYRLYIN